MGYTADQLVGKTLYAKTNVPAKRIAEDGAPVFYTIMPGEKVGVVYSWLGVKPGRSVVHWMFYDDAGDAYYVEHRSHYFNLNNLRDQGLMTHEEERSNDRSTWEKSASTIAKGLASAAGLFFLGKLITGS